MHICAGRWPSARRAPSSISTRTASRSPRRRVAIASMADDDTFRLDERLLKLGMIYDWKMKKGSPYAEDMGTYSDAIANAMGRDKPSPIIIGGRPAPDVWGGHALY